MNPALSDVYPELRDAALTRRRMRIPIPFKWYRDNPTKRALHEAMISRLPTLASNICDTSPLLRRLMSRS